MSSVTATQSTTSTSTTTSSSLASLNITADDFLQLLIAQIQNQDPLSPMDDTEFISQTAQFLQLEESRNTNDWLEILANPDSGSSVINAAHLIGKEVTAGYGDSEVTGKVTAVCVEDGVVKLLVGGYLVNASDVVSVSEGE